ncbi:MAG: tRNA lysidine(34) synthetase TilS [Acidobacteria bacterium]|nr:tRNA lysidine(34) synthetase TilS [Acidobacteriota bacterium]
MLDRIRSALKALEPAVAGRTLGVACSGGADSTALLTALAALRGELGFDLAVVHLNHRLRGEASEADEIFVRDLAAAHGLAAHVRGEDVATLAADWGCGLEDAGRRARYAWFAGLIAEGICDRIATGHTLSDQAETVLFRLARGSGLRGLAGIRPEREPGIIRPLLGVSGSEIRDFLRERGLTWREDESNRDRRFRRNQIRHDVGPRLAEINPRWESALARTAEQALSEEAYWSEIVAVAAARVLQRGEAGIRLKVSAFSELHPAVQRRLLRTAAEEAGGAALGADHIEALRELCEPGRGSGEASMPGLTARRSLDAVMLSPPARAEVPVEPARRVEPPAELLAPDRRSRIRFEIASQHSGIGRYTEPIRAGLDWKRLPAPLVLRAWRPGDRWQSSSPSRTMKLKSLFQKARVEVWDRPGWPVLCAGDQVVWTRAYGVAEPWQADAESRECLTVREVHLTGREICGIEQWLDSVYGL